MVFMDTAELGKKGKGMVKVRHWPWFAFVLLSVGIVGCSKSDTVRMTGKVTLDGIPLETGEVRFTSTDGSVQPSGGSIVAGSYDIRVSPGQKNVQILGLKKVGERVLYPGSPNSPTAPVMKTIVDKIVPYQVTSTGRKDFDLTSK
jgi:hypothetical protein